MKQMLRKTMLTAMAALVMSPLAFGAVSAGKKTGELTKLENDVRHELVMLPWFGVFDNMEFKVEGDHVTLYGQVTRPTLKTDAERVVSRIEGVEKITNNIEVLPLSPHDDRVRMATYYAIFGYGPLQRYGWGAVPPIRIIVKNGDITLKGVVANEMDKNLAYMRANSVSGAFSVTNDLALENQNRS